MVGEESPLPDENHHLGEVRVAGSNPSSAQNDQVKGTLSTQPYPYRFAFLQAMPTAVAAT